MIIEMILSCRGLSETKIALLVNSLIVLAVVSPIAKQVVIAGI
jgi:hypothetical protein